MDVNDMLTTYRSRFYKDFNTSRFNGQILLTPENACFVDYRNLSFVNTTSIIDQFLADKKDYMLLRLGYAYRGVLYAILERRLSGLAPKSACPISSILQYSVCLHEDNTYFSWPGSIPPRVAPIFLNAMNCLPASGKRGIYNLQTASLPVVKAQSTDDRGGFGKTHLFNKPYGYCSEAFTMVGAYLADI